MVRRFITVVASIGLVATPVLASNDKVGDDGFADSTPFLDVKPKDKPANAPQRLSSCYFRLNVAQTPASTGATTDFGHDVRPWWRRMFNGVDYTFTAAAKVNVGLFEDTVILYSRRYRSSLDEGENHDRAVIVEGRDFPVFLLENDTNGEANILLTADLKSAQTFQLAGSALEAVTAGLKAVAPTADIVTTLTSDATSKVAQNIDEGAGTFVGITGANAERYDLNVKEGGTLIVTVYGPKHEVNPNNTDFTLGQWEISLDPAFGSYFEQSECSTNFETEAWKSRFDNSNLLSKKLIENVGDIGTVEAYIRQLEWWPEKLSATEGKAANSSQVADLCTALTGAVAELGFNTIDAYLAVDAVSRSSLVGAKQGDAMRGTAQCDYMKATASQ